MTVCPHYCCLNCVNGNCPISNRDLLIEYCIPVTDSCEECSYYKGCEGCDYNNTDECPIDNVTKKFIKALKNVLIELMVKENITG